MNLMERLQKEIKRVQEIIKVYDELPKNAGAMASNFMKNSVMKAEKAISEIDTIKMMQALQELKEYEY